MRRRTPEEVKAYHQGFKAAMVHVSEWISKERAWADALLKDK